MSSLSLMKSDASTVLSSPQDKTSVFSVLELIPAPQSSAQLHALQSVAPMWRSSDKHFLFTVHESHTHRHTQMLQDDVLNRRLSSKLFKTNIASGLLPVFLCSCVFGSFSLCVLFFFEKNWLDCECQFYEITFAHTCYCLHLCMCFFFSCPVVTQAT